jgi:TAP-like protein
MMPLLAEMDVRALLPTIRVPTLVLHHTDDPVIPPEWGKDVADRIPGAKYVELPGRNLNHFYEPDWRSSFQEMAEFVTGERANVADDRVLATLLFTDIVDPTRRAAEIGDRDWHALLDAHDAVVRAQLARFRGREVNTSGDGFLAMFDGPASDPLCDGDPRRRVGARHRGAGRVAHRRVSGRGSSSMTAGLINSRVCQANGICPPSLLRSGAQNGGGLLRTAVSMWLRRRSAL